MMILCMKSDVHVWMCIQTYKPRPLNYFPPWCFSFMKFPLWCLEWNSLAVTDSNISTSPLPAAGCQADRCWRSICTDKMGRLLHKLPPAIRTKNWAGLLPPGSFAVTLSCLLLFRPQERCGGKRRANEGRMRGNSWGKGVWQLFPKPSIAKVTIGREKKEKDQTVTAWSFCTSAQTVGKMMGLNKNASNNKKETFPVVFLAWRMNCLKHWPPCLSQWGQKTDCHSYDYD